MVAAVVPLAAACGAGQNATTMNYYAPADGLNVVHNGVRVLNALVVGPPTGSRDAAISMVVANDANQADSIASIDAGPAGTVEILGPRDIPPRSALGFAGPSATSSAVIRNLTAKVGESVTLRIVMRQAGAVPALRTIVTPPDGYYQGFVATPTGGGFASPAASPVSPVTPSAGFGAGTPVGSRPPETPAPATSLPSPAPTAG